MVAQRNAGDGCSAAAGVEQGWYKTWCLAAVGAVVEGISCGLFSSVYYYYFLVFDLYFGFDDAVAVGSDVVRDEGHYFGSWFCDLKWKHMATVFLVLLV